MSEPTYGQLDAALLSLGFVLSAVQQENKWFRHPCGALIVYPEMPADQLVLGRHLTGVRAILDAYGLPDPFVAAAVPQKAS